MVIVLSCAPAFADVITCGNIVGVPTPNQVERLKETIDQYTNRLSVFKKDYAVSCGEGRSSIFNSRAAGVANEKIDKCLAAKKDYPLSENRFTSKLEQSFTQISENLGAKYVADLKSKINALPVADRRQALANLVKAETNSEITIEIVDKYLKDFADQDRFCEGLTQKMITDYQKQKEPFDNCLKLKKDIAEENRTLEEYEQDHFSSKQKVAQYKMCLEKALNLNAVTNTDSDTTGRP